MVMWLDKAWKGFYANGGARRAKAAFQRCGMLNAMDGSEDHMIKVEGCPAYALEGDSVRADTWSICHSPTNSRAWRPRIFDMTVLVIHGFYQCTTKKKVCFWVFGLIFAIFSFYLTIFSHSSCAMVCSLPVLSRTPECVSGRASHCLFDLGSTAERVPAVCNLSIFTSHLYITQNKARTMCHVCVCVCVRYMQTILSIGLQGTQNITQVQYIPVVDEFSQNIEFPLKKKSGHMRVSNPHLDFFMLMLIFLIWAE